MTNMSDTSTSRATAPAARTEPDKAAIMGGVIPYLSLGTDVGEAIDFYERAFDAVLVDEPARGESGKILNATLAINGGAFMLMDHPDGAEGTPAQSGQGVLLQLVVADGDAWWSRAVAAGCTPTDPFGEKFWGDRYGRLRDPIGQDWAILEPSAARRSLSSADRARSGMAEQGANA